MRLVLSSIANICLADIWFMVKIKHLGPLEKDFSETEQKLRQFYFTLSKQEQNEVFQ